MLDSLDFSFVSEASCRTTALLYCCAKSPFISVITTRQLFMRVEPCQCR